jgi:hypothetical protein
MRQDSSIHVYQIEPSSSAASSIVRIRSEWLRSIWLFRAHQSKLACSISAMSRFGQRAVAIHPSAAPAIPPSPPSPPMPPSPAAPPLPVEVAVVVPPDVVAPPDVVRVPPLPVVPVPVVVLVVRVAPVVVLVCDGWSSSSSLPQATKTEIIEPTARQDSDRRLIVVTFARRHAESGPRTSAETRQGPNGQTSHQRQVTGPVQQGPVSSVAQQIAPVVPIWRLTAKSWIRTTEANLSTTAQVGRPAVPP